MRLLKYWLVGGLVCVGLGGCAADPVEEVIYSPIVVTGKYPAEPMGSKHGASHFNDEVQPGIRVTRFDSEYALVNDYKAVLSSKDDAASSNQHVVGINGMDTFQVDESAKSATAGMEGKTAPGCDCSVIGDIFFELNSSVLTSEAMKMLSEMPVNGKSLEVIGYADALGNTSRNLVLAKGRASAVASVLGKRAKAVKVKAWLESEFEGSQFRKVIVVGLNAD